MKETALTLPLDVVERLLVMAMNDARNTGFETAEEIEAVKLVEREIEQVRRLAGCCDSV